VAQQRFLGFLLGLFCQLTGARGDTDQRKNPHACRTFRISVPYQEQWNKLLSMADEIKQFIADNQDKLKVKEG
jgi:hypothetical protein